MNDLENFVGGQEPASNQQPGAQDPAPEANQTPSNDPAPDTGDGNNNNVIRQMREEIAKNKTKANELNTMLERVAKSAGMSVEEYMKQLDDNELKAKADQNKITPELQRQLDEQSNRLKYFEEAQQKAIFNRNMNELISSQNITEDEAADFLRAVSQKGIDVVQSPLTHKELYFAINGENIIKNIKETVRQEVLAEMQERKTKIPGTNPGGTSDGSKGGLEDFIADFTKK